MSARPALSVVAAGDYAARIAAQMTAAGIETPPDRIIADGRLHRFSSAPGRRNASGWYVVHDDPTGAVWFFGDWRPGIKANGEADPGRWLDTEEVRAQAPARRTVEAHRCGRSTLPGRRPQAQSARRPAQGVFLPDRRAW